MPIGVSREQENAMPITNDVSGLPTARDEEGNPPVRTPLIVTQLAETWYQQYLDDGEDEAPSMVEGSRWRASWSGMCARAVQYNIRERDARIRINEINAMGDNAVAEVGDKAIRAAAEAVLAAQPTNPNTIADAWRFSLGHLVEKALEPTVKAAFPGAQFQVKVTIDDFGSATVDMVITEPGVEDFVTVVELKTTNGFGYKMMATDFKGPAEGPRHSALVQGAMSAARLNADRLIIGYLSLENLSPDLAKSMGIGEIGRFAAEWHYTPEQFNAIAAKETKRVLRIIEAEDAGVLVPRSIPELPIGARVTNPNNGSWTVTNEGGAVTQAGKTWQCGYCSNRDRCNRDGA
jgi:hypothetical protein